MYEIRVYYTRYNMDPNYYGGTKGVWRRWKAKTPEELIRKWKEHLEKYAGDTYSVWDLNTGDMITGGAYDPGDVDYIEEYFKEENTPLYLEGCD